MKYSIMGKKNKGFTLVEMMVVILVMSIMLGATMWGVTGWIHHFTYIKSEETARYIYMGAQSGLSAYSARGTLDELFDSIRKQSESGSADVIVVDPGDKEGFGLPINPDNRNKDHEYAYLKVPKGGLDQNPLLYSLVKPYLSDKESLDGSMVVELDMTSRKVYSTFYSPWAAGFSYGSANYPAAIKGTFPIFKQSIGGADVDTRAESERTECCIGYYASDQINVSDLKMTKNLDIDYLHLYNDETLHLDFRSDADQENNTTYDITIQSVANNGTVTDEFTVVFDPSVALGTFDDTTTYTPWKTSLPIKDSVLGADATCDFYVGYQKSLQEGLEDDDEIRDLVLILDTQGIGQVHGLAAKESAEGYSDKSTMSITSLLGDDPKNIRAVVSVYPNASGMAYYSVTPGTKESNVENDLFATDLSDENNPGSDPVINPGEYSIANTRHLSNIRYYERRKENGLAGGPATYTLKRDIYWNNAQVYDCADHVYLKSGAVEAFATIPYLSQDSMLDGAGRAIYDLNLNNSSYVVYPRLANGRVDEDDKNNQADMIGMIAKNSGTVKGLVLRGAKAEYLTSAQANIDQASADKNRIYSDKIQAAGIICGRDMGSMQEIYLDDACSLKAAIFQADTPDRTVGCGIGMLAGTVNLEKAATAQVHDRLRTGGTLTATLDSRFDKVAYAAEEYPGRNLVYEGANADAHDYGVGGMFGYVYGDYTATGNGLKQPVVGLMEDEVIAKAGAGGYMTAPVDLRQPDETNKKTDAQRTNDQTDVFKDWKWSLENRCVVNDENTAANMEFVGGILGNIQVDLPGAIAHKQDDEDDWTIPDGLVENIAGCRNYGAVTGADLVGGITGINGPTVYIADCVSYSDMKAVNGVAAGIAAENYGYIKNCRVERAAGDEVRPDGYFPLLDGNETVAGAVTSVNYHQAVIMDCAVSSPEEEKELALNQGTIPGDDDIIKIKGNEMDTIGYLAGINYGTIDGGTIGSFVGYQSDKENMVIGGVAGINHTDGVIKHIESSIDFDTSDAKFVGGIAGRNSGDIRSCIFSGKITQPARERSVAGICYGGIAAINTKDKDFAIKQIPLITNCYLVGFSIDAKGYGNYLAENTESQMIDRCSAIGGVCGTNDIESKITDCYATAHYMLDDSGDALKDALNKDIIKEQSKLTVKNGLVGGITGLNKGDLIHCGYSDKVILLQSDLDEAGSQAAIKYASKITRKDDRKLLSALCQAQLSDAETSSMQLADTVAHYLETAVQQQTYPADSDSFIGTNAWTAGRNAAIAEIRTALANGGYEENEAEIRTMAAEKLRLSLMDDGRGELKNSVAKYCGTLNDDNKTDPVTGDALNAYPKYNTQGDAAHYIDAINTHYDAGENTYVISSEGGISNVGGIAGYNAKDGDLLYCSSGKWLVESYLPSVSYTGTGGITGKNASDKEFCYNTNFAYVRRELEPLSDYWKAGDTSLDSRHYTHKYQYVGGVVGIQMNTTSGDWAVKGCVNAGKVVNMFGNNVAGIICLWSKNGGTVEECYNYGKLITGYSDDHFDGYGNPRKSGGGGWNGTAGGIVGHMVDLDLRYYVNILSCQNHGVVNLPMRGLDRRTRIMTSTNVIYCANDVGGVVGEISATNGEQIYVLNVTDCVNGKDAEIYGHGSCSGIIGYTGGFSSLGGSGQLYATGVVLNVHMCRNYSSYIFQKGGNYNEIARNFTQAALEHNSTKVTGLVAGLERNEGEGYISLRYNLSVRMRDRNIRYNNQFIRKFKNPKRSYLDLCGYNFFIDNLSWQYMNYDNAAFPQLKNLGNEYKKRDATVSLNASDANQTAANKEIVYENASQDNINGLFTYNANSHGSEEGIMDYWANARRLFGVTVKDGANRTEHHALTWQALDNHISTLDAKNSWIESTPEGDVIMQRYEDKNDPTVSHEETFGPVVTYFDEVPAESGRTYSNALNNHFNFREAVLNGSVSGSRMPFADEFDFDYYRLDRDYMKFADKLNGTLLSPDRVIHVDVKEDNNNGFYKATWDLQAGSVDFVTSVSEFDVRIEYYELDEKTQTGEDNAFDLSKYNPTQQKYDGKAAVKVTETKSKAKLTTFIMPDDLDVHAGKIYYAVVRAKDANGDESYFSDVTEGEYTSFIRLKKKLAVPEFEIVSFGGKWMLHLKNADDYAEYINSEDSDFEVGAYVMGANNNTSRGYSFRRTDLTTDTNNPDGPLLVNAKECSTYFATGKKDLSLRVYAKEGNALGSDYSVMTVYVPVNPNPAIKSELQDVTWEDQAGLLDRPVYKATLKYQEYDEGSGITAETAQVFRAELFGIATGDDGKEYHETIAMKEYALHAGESVQVALGYYDVPSGIDLSKYDSFDADIWYASAGQGDVYQYIKTIEGKAAGKKRSTGYITDLTATDVEEKYLFRSVIRLTDPQFDLVKLERSGHWYARLLNTDDYEGIDDVVITVSSADRTSSFSAVTPHDPQLGFYGGLVNGKNDNTSNVGTVSAKASSPGYFDSNAVLFGEGDSYGAVNRKYNIGGGSGINMTGLSAESFTMDAQGNLKYYGKLHTTVLNDASQPQYMAVEIFAKDAGDEGKVKTIYFDPLHKVEPENGVQKTVNGTNVIEGDITLDITVQPSESMGLGDLSRFYDHHVTVWYSGANYPSTNTKMMTQFFDISQTAAENLGYNRSNGVLRYIGSDETIRESGQAEAYFYAAPLKDPTYKNDNKWKLKADGNATIAKITSAAADTDVDGRVNWAVANDIDAGNTYRLSLDYFRVPKTTVISSVDDLKAALNNASGNGNGDGTEDQGDDGEGGSVSGNSVSGNSVSGNSAGEDPEGSTPEEGIPGEGDPESGSEATEIVRVAHTVTDPVSSVSYDVLLPDAGWYLEGFSGLDTAYDYYVLVSIIDSDLLDENGALIKDSYMTGYGAETFVKMPIKLNPPNIEFLKLTKALDNKWYARLVNYKDYEGTNAVIYINVGTTLYTIDTAADPGQGLDSVMKYSVEVTTGTGNANTQQRRKYAWAVAEGYLDSEVFNYDETTKDSDVSNIRLKRSLIGNQTYVNLSAFHDETFTRTADSIHYHGYLDASAHTDTNEKQYITIEMYGTNASGITETIYLECDKILDSSLNQTVEIDIPLTNDSTGLTLSDYTDLHVVCWYSGMYYTQRTPNRYLRTWFRTDAELTDEEATRANGIIRFAGKSYTVLGGDPIVVEDTQKPVFFRAAPLNDPDFATLTSTNPKDLMYLQSETEVTGE